MSRRDGGGPVTAHTARTETRDVLQRDLVLCPMEGAFRPSPYGPLGAKT
jgi:hypothetical protein